MIEGSEHAVGTKRYIFLKKHLFLFIWLCWVSAMTDGILDLCCSMWHL